MSDSRKLEVEELVGAVASSNPESSGLALIPNSGPRQ